MKNTQKLVLLMLFDVVCVFGFSQATHKTNSISITTAIYSFYDGEPVLQLKNFNKNFSAKSNSFFPNPICIGYQKKMSSKNYWAIGIDMFYKYNLKDITELKKDKYWIRNFINFKGLYLHDLFDKTERSLFLLSGLSLRQGKNSYFNGYIEYPTYNYPLYYRRTLLDVSVFFGIRYKHYFKNNLCFISELNHSYFFYIFDENHISSANRNVSFLSFGLSWDFDRAK